MVLPFYMLTPQALLIFQIQKDGIDSFGLLANRVNYLIVGRKSLVKIHVIVKVASTRKTMLEEAFEYLISHVHQVFLLMLLSIFYCVEGIEQYSSAETNLHGRIWLAIISEQCMS